MNLKIKLLTFLLQIKNLITNSCNYLVAKGRLYSKQSNHYTIHEDCDFFLATGVRNGLHNSFFRKACNMHFAKQINYHQVPADITFN